MLNPDVRNQDLYIPMYKVKFVELKRVISRSGPSPVQILKTKTQ